jgi:hypothetical protein
LQSKAVKAQPVAFAQGKITILVSFYGTFSIGASSWYSEDQRHQRLLRCQQFKNFASTYDSMSENKSKKKWKQVVVNGPLHSNQPASAEHLFRL